MSVGRGGELGGVLIGGRYRLVERLGVGGMAEVWVGEDENLGREVAVKVLTPSRGVEGVGWEELLARFEREARLVAGLESPFVVTLHDFGTAEVGGERGAFLVMSLVRGRSLQEVVDGEGRVGVGVALRWVEEVCRALVVAHGAGVVHRDIKPANVMVAEDGGVRVLDFGIAGLAEGSSVVESGLTRAGDVPFGSVLYMAPERFREHASDPAVDLYAVGCVLYELLASRPPFVGPAAGVMYNHLHDEPVRLGLVRGGVPVGVERLVGELMAKDPGGRPGSALEVAERLMVLRREVESRSEVEESGSAGEVAGKTGPEKRTRPRPRPRPQPQPARTRKPRPAPRVVSPARPGPLVEPQRPAPPSSRAVPPRLLSSAGARAERLPSGRRPAEPARRGGSAVVPFRPLPEKQHSRRLRRWITVLLIAVLGVLFCGLLLAPSQSSASDQSLIGYQTDSGAGRSGLAAAEQAVRTARDTVDPPLLPTGAGYTHVPDQTETPTTAL